MKIEVTWTVTRTMRAVIEANSINEAEEKVLNYGGHIIEEEIDQDLNNVEGKVFDWQKEYKSKEYKSKLMERFKIYHIDPPTLKERDKSGE